MVHLKRINQNSGLSMDYLMMLKDKLIKINYIEKNKFNYKIFPIKKYEDYFSKCVEISSFKDSPNVKKLDQIVEEMNLAILHKNYHDFRNLYYTCMDLIYDNK